MAKKSALGSNFSSIFDDDVFGAEENIAPQKLRITEIEPNKKQPRKTFNEEALNALAESIMENGIIQPLTVRPYGDIYQIVAGERRWRAAKIAGLSEVPVRIMELSDEQVALIALIENLQREDLNPIEEALGYQNLIDTYGIKQDEVAKKVGKARSTIANSLRLLTLPEDVKTMVRDGKLSVGHCKVIIGVPDEKNQRELAQKVINDGISVRALEKLAKQLTTEKKTKTQPSKEVFIVEAEISMTDYIGKPVRIDKSKDRYTMSIDCKSEEELRELISFLSKR
ncbi:MAG: ParB/RepB/Spo0J family partition protein [Ruminiclostridium sp.]|nr:ParB/RepB/Spo0J family partition protein [Ruminiclostridium sp.]MBQ8410231.1 ParB/RepB/Spo0J family partition protein [Ruminiclostridium sp.]MBQ8843083.1 ParB/RepB/Spo0J family partition protein [Ruminiclostridium sp.]